MWSKLLVTILCFIVSGLEFKSIGSVRSSLKAPQIESNAQQRVALGASNRQFVALKRINPIKAILSRPRVSPLYLINGTVCRLINFQPVCTTLSTTGLAVGGSSSGSGGTAARPSGGSSSSGGGGSGAGSGGGSGGGGAGGGARPSTAGVLSGGSSVQFANQPNRVSALVQNDQPGVYVERAEPSSDQPNKSPSQPYDVAQTSTQALSVLVPRRPIRLFPFRRATQPPQISAQARQAAYHQAIEAERKKSE